MLKYNLDVVLVSYKTPELIQIVLDSFNKFVTKDFNLKFIIVENSDFNLLERLKKESLKNVIVINNPIKTNFSYAHGDGLEAAKPYMSDDASYVFTCHSDTCVTSFSFFDTLKSCIDEDVFLAGVCEDKHPERIKALHCSGLLAKSNLYKNVSLKANLPKIDTADLLTVYCRENNLKTRLFKNTYNDENLVDLCNLPFKEMDKNCGVDRCLDDNNNVMFIHQGRGTTKYSNSYFAPNKIMTKDWLEFCDKFLFGI